MKTTTFGWTGRVGAAGALCAALALASCGGGGGIGGTGSRAEGMGTLRVSLTDAPACGYDEVNVTIERVRVNRSSTAEDGDAGWTDIVLSPARRVNLLELTNGALVELGQTELPAGRYSQLRLVLASNAGTDPPANSVVVTGSGPVSSRERALDTPSGQQSGVKLNANIDVPAGQVADVVLDFDACKSVVTRGNSGRYNLKPVIAVIPVFSTAQRVEGYVDPFLALPTTSVSVQVNGAPVRSTPPDTTGKFVLSPVPTGTYDLVVTAAGRVTAVMTGVTVDGVLPARVSNEKFPINPPAATELPRTVTGTVTPAPAAGTVLLADVYVRQTLAGGPTVEVASKPADGSTGAFEFDLPIDSAVRTSYAGTPTATIVFAPSGTPGQYSFSATLGGVTRTGTPDPVTVPASPTAVPTVTIAFP